MNRLHDTLTARELLRHAAVWRFLSLALQRPTPEQKNQLLRHAAELKDPSLEFIAQGAAEMTEGAYLELLGPGGQVPVREVGYRQQADPGQLLADLKAFYDAFAFDPRTEDPLDHLSTEVAFVSFLRLKESYAETSGAAEARATTSRGLDSFLSGHLAEFAEGFSFRIQRVTDDYLSETARQIHQKVREVTGVVTFSDQE